MTTSSSNRLTCDPDCLRVKLMVPFTAAGNCRSTDIGARKYQVSPIASSLPVIYPPPPAVNAGATVPVSPATCQPWADSVNSWLTSTDPAGACAMAGCPAIINAKFKMHNANTDSGFRRRLHFDSCILNYE